MPDDDIYNHDYSLVNEFGEVEDVNCDLCGQLFNRRVLSTGVCIQSRRPFEACMNEGIKPQLNLCMACAAETARAYQSAARQHDRCDHDVPNGQWCFTCHRDFRQACEANSPE